MSAVALAGAKEVFYLQKTDEKIEFSRQARMIAVCVIANPSSQCYNYIASEKQGETYFISQAVSTEMMTVMVTMETAVVTAMEEDRRRVSSPIFSA